MNKEMEDALSRLHAGHKVILRELTRICDKHHIHYYLESGTLLGAVRHKASIPWDDDADIAMLRSDFEIFRQVVREEMGPEFFYVEPDELGKKAIYDFVPRFGLRDSQVRPDSPKEQYYGGGILNHLLIDIFILDDLADNTLLHKWNLAAITLVYGLSMGHRYTLDWSEYKGASKVAVRILATIGKLFPAQFLVHRYEKICRRETGKNPQKNRCYYGNYLFGDIPQVYQKDWFEPIQMYELDGEFFPGPGNFDRCLTTLFGDYMTPPPPEQRVVRTHMNPECVIINIPAGEERS